MLFGKIQEESDIFILVGKVKSIGLYFVIIPHDIYTERIESHGLKHEDAMLPILLWQTGIMNFS